MSAGSSGKTGPDLGQMNYQAIRDMWDKVKEACGPEMVPRLLIGGKTGVGKSSVLNAILGKDVFEIGVLPTTRPGGDNEAMWTTEGGAFKVFDTPGFGEAEVEGGCDYAKMLRDIVDMEAHVFLLVLKCDDRAMDTEKRWLDEARKGLFFEKVPTLCVVNQIDKLNPNREWEPKTLNLDAPTTQKEKNIRSYLDYVASLDAFRPFAEKKRILPVSAGEFATDPTQYGIDTLRRKIYDLLPDAAKTAYARQTELQRIEGQRLIKYFAGTAAAAVAANFIPGSDALVIAPIQLAMIAKLGAVHGIEVTAATVSGLLSSVGMSFAGRFVSQQLVSFIPFVKNFVGPPLAFGLTYSLGLAVNELFAEGKTQATREEMDNLASKYKNETNLATEEFRK